MAIVSKNNSTYSASDFWALYVLVAVFICVRIFVSGGFVPDLLEMNKIEPKNFFSLLASTAASFLGILIAALLLTFQLLSRENKRRKERNILFNRWVISFGCLSIFLVAALIYSYVAIERFSAPTDLTIGYYLLIVFMVFIITIIPVVRIVLDETNSLKKTLQIISTLELADFRITEEAYFRDTWLSSPNRKLSIIKDEIVYAIRDNDNSGLHSLLTEFTNTATTFLHPMFTRNDCEAVINSWSFVCKDAETNAKKAVGLYFYEIVCGASQMLYQHAAMNRLPLMYYFRVQLFLRDMAENLCKEGNVAGVKKLTETLNHSLKVHLQYNCPAEDNLYNLHRLYKQKRPHYDVDSSIQWDGINDFITDLTGIKKYAIEYSSKEIFRDSGRNLEMLVRHIQHDDFPELGKLQRAYLLTSIISLGQVYLSEKALKEKLFPDTLYSYQLEGSTVAEVIVKDQLASKRILTSIGDHLINAMRDNQLNDWTLNSLGAIPRHTAKYYLSNQSVKDGTLYIFNVLLQMKKEIEREARPENKKIYDEIKSQLNALIGSLAENETEHEKIQLIKAIQKSLKNSKKIKGDSEFNIVPWPK